MFEVSRHDADLLAEAFLAGVRLRGLEPGSMLAFSCANSPSLLAAVFGCLRSGLAPVVLSASLTPSERDDMLRDLPIELVVDDRLLSALRAGTSRPGDAPAMGESFRCRPLHFTSGTSGRPKAVWSGWVAEEQARASADDEQSAWSFDAADRHLVNAPLSHSAPLRFALNTLLHGGTAIVPPRFDVDTASELVATAGVTTTFMAPVHLQRLLTQAPPATHTLRLLAHAGSACPTRVKQHAVDLFGAPVVTEFYGSTEGQFTVCSTAEWAAHPGTVGRARPGRRLEIVDGQIWCEAPPHARFEYWGDPEKTAAAWDGAWFTVGDLGRLDAEGYLYLEGRRSDLIVTGGVNVYPAEVERVLGEVRGVDKVCVVGVEDPEWGRRVCAVLTGDVTEQTVREYAAAHLAPYKRPKTVLIVDELPLTHSGKIDRTRVADALEGPPGSVHGP
jgi:acyl-CoA synthetase (AMP-forming)/AMP-acid ligase II